MTTFRFGPTPDAEWSTGAQAIKLNGNPWKRDVMGRPYMSGPATLEVQGDCDALCRLLGEGRRFGDGVPGFLTTILASERMRVHLRCLANLIEADAGWAKFAIWMTANLPPDLGWLAELVEESTRWAAQENGSATLAGKGGPLWWRYEESEGTSDFPAQLPHPEGE